MPSQLKLDSRGYETRQHGSHDFPVSSGRTKLSNYSDNRFALHWHTDPEFTVIVSGEMNYQVNDHVYSLREGNGIFVNSNMLHSGWNEEGDCQYITVNFDPKLLFGFDDSRPYKNYIEPVVNSPVLSAMVFDETADNCERQILELFRSVNECYRQTPECYELTVLAKLTEAMSLIAPKALKEIESLGSVRVTKQLARMKNAIDFIDNNYSEQITLLDLANVCGLSRSEVCRSFTTMLRQTPMEYVANVRIRKSLPLLASGDYSVTQVAELCGFSGSSYFAEMFRRHMSCTPSEYAKSDNNIRKKQK